MLEADEKTPAESPISILKEIKALGEITQKVADNTLEIKADISLIFRHLAKLDTRIAFTFGVALISLVVALFALFLVVAGKWNNG